MNNREIKFEYGFESVNGIVKKVYHLHEIPFINDKCDVWNVLPIKYVRQYAGLNDKNGVEIYDGDILGGHPHGTVQVKWSDKWACFESVSIENTFDSDGEPIEHEIGSLFANDLKDCFNEWSVIGNIHQNPELYGK